MIVLQLWLTLLLYLYTYQTITYYPTDFLHTLSQELALANCLLNHTHLIQFLHYFLEKLSLKVTRSRNFVSSALMAGSGVFSEIFDGEVYKYYVDGEWKKSSSGKSVAIINPTTRKTQYKVQACTQEEVNKVMEMAKAAQKLWARTPLWKRAELLHKAAAILKEHKAPIGECLVKEIAKPAKDAVTEVLHS
ncbi:hypothetical protein Leryth_007637 [Lithospermum erythrorhizon]|nr:hypothetical protein Leryth_007637 [Lithospermum erythrorhizon]